MDDWYAPRDATGSSPSSSHAEHGFEMNARRRRRLADFGFLALLCVCALLAWAGFEYHFSRVLEDVRTAHEQVLQRDTRHLNTHIGHLLRNVDLNLISLGRAIDADAPSPEWTSRLESVIQHIPYLRSLSVVAADGTVIASTTPENRGTALRLDSYHPPDRTRGDILQIGPPHAGRDLADARPADDSLTPTPDLGFVPIARSFRPGNAPPVALLATLDLDYLERILDDFRTTHGDRISLFRLDGIRLLDTATADTALQQLEQALALRWQAGETAGMQTLDGEQGHLLVSYQLNERLPFAVVISSALDEALAGAYAESRSSALIFLPLSLLGLGCTLAAYLYFRRAGQHERSLRHRAEARRHLLESALNASATAVVITGTDARIEWANPAFTTLTGYGLSEAVGRMPKELVRSGQQSREFYESMWRTILSGAVWRGELVNRRKDGSLYDEALTITPVRDEQGTLTHFIAIKEDITATRAARKDLQAAYARLQTVVDHFPGAVIMEDMQGQITLLNDKVFDLMNMPRPPGNLAGASIKSLTLAAGKLSLDPTTFAQRLDMLRERAQTVYGEELAHRDGRWIERDFIPIRSTGSTDALLGFLRVYRDVSARKQQEKALWLLATTDPLTGVRNRRAFLDKVDAELVRVRRYRNNAALMMLDLDYFKRVNDLHGHAAGDAMLCHVVTLAHSLLRASDLIGRLGGEEFAILLPATGLAGALELAERLRSTLENTPLVYQNRDIGATTSIGVSLMQADDSNAEMILARADSALYAAKHNGRNRVEQA
ncbi:hypothetical protein CEW87_11930 [Parazoarcus communis]|uniref:Sensor domain-containing diguanylate cyclase n=2 Tax=Parazoarcus communis TaxID=41977 RepID=A0A2U8H2S9_9RHOO|nr:hypothetical protein CEW87_11930 [Parazoarcus communis]